MAMPENARYAKMRLVGGATDVDQAGTVYFDEVGFGINPTLSFSLTPGSLRIRDSDSVIATRLSPWVKVREHVMARGGTVSVTFSLKGGSHLDPINGSTVADMIYGRIYVNGVAVGTQRQTNDYTLYTAWTEDITVKPGDRLQLYVYVPNSSYCYTSLFQIGVAELLESAAGATM